MFRSRYVRPRAFASTYGGGLLAGFAASFAPAPFSGLLFHGSVGLAAFAATVGGAVLAWERAEARMPELGRRGGGALLLVGLAGGLVTYAGALAIRATLHAAPAGGFGLLATAAALAGAAPLLALKQEATPIRLLNTISAAGFIAASAAWLPWPLLAFPQGIAFAGLLLTWVGDGEVPGEGSPGPGDRAR